MCGIVGYVGDKKVIEVLLDGLRQLEYRGYDSAGIGILSNGKIKIIKRSGKIKDLARLLNETKNLYGISLGIGHTRWATHGHPTNINAHPHMDCSGRISVVHNGIIENYGQLKSQLIAEGHIFRSDTDTEVIAHIFEKYYRGDVKQALLKTVNLLKGSFAIGVICGDEPDKIMGARRESPLVIGVGENENLIASDIPAILRYTKNVIYLEDNEIAILTKNRVEVFDIDGRPKDKSVDIIRWNLASAQKGGFPHFMLKEIFEQPKVLQQIISFRIKNDTIILDGFCLSDREIRGISNIIILACGTAYHAGLVGKYILERFARIPVFIDVSSEFRYRDPIITRDTLIIAISQSGETADTLAAVKEGKKRGARIICICNVVGSSLVRISDDILYTYAGPEISVASTKAYTAQLAILYLLAIYLAERRDILTGRSKKFLLNQLKLTPALIRQILDNKNTIRCIANKHSNMGSFLYLGRNINFPTALEGALKLKEISYIPAEGYPAGEMKHGPIALIDEYRAVVCIIPASSIYEKMVSNMQEIYARRGKIIAIATQGDEAIKKFTKEIIYIPKIDEMFSPLLSIVPLQLLAYYIAIRRGCDVDQPRNLAKSVTVE